MPKLALQNQIKFKENPENIILRLLFGVIQSSDWAQYEFKISFKARKNGTGAGFQVREMKIKSPEFKKTKYKSPLDRILPKPKKIKLKLEELEAIE